MSHFSVLVIHHPTVCIEGLLQPFHEFECTGEDDQYVKSVDITAQVQADIDAQGSLEKGLEWDGYENVVASEADIDLTATHKYGYVVVQDGKLVKAVKRTNPNKKWDWYQVGGRFNSKLLTRNGETVDEAPLANVDFDAMVQRSADRAAARYDRAQGFLKGTECPRLWTQILVDCDQDLDRARAIYQEQSAVKAAKKDHEDLIWAGGDELIAFFDSREKFIESARKSAFTPFAILRNGKWFEKGKMGWWACVSNEKETGDWQQEVKTLLQDLPLYTLLTIVDCHI